VKRRLVALALLTGVVWLVPNSPALAHPSLVRSDPTDGQTVSEPLGDIRLWYDEELRIAFSTFDVRDMQGRAVRILDIGQPQPGLVIIDLPELGRGVYTLSWRVLSNDDNHFTGGLLILGVGVAVSAEARAAPQPEIPIRAVDIALRWLDIVTLAGLIGALAVNRLVLDPRARPLEAGALRQAARRRVLGLATWCGVAALGTGMLLLVAQLQQVRDALGGGPLPGIIPLLLFEGRWGALWWARQAVVMMLTAVAWMLRRAEAPPGEAMEPDSMPSRVQRLRDGAWPATVVLAVILAQVHASGGHPAAVAERPWLAIAADSLHLLAASVWMGGLLALAVGLSPLVHRRRELTALVRATWRPFGRVAAVCLGLLVATGLYGAAQQVASIDALLITPYGQALMAKVGLGLAAGVVGIASATVLQPRLVALLARLLRRGPRWTPISPARLPRLVAAELSLGALVFGAVGLMGSAPPARGPAFEPGIGSALSTQTLQIDDVLVTLTVKPNLPGPNVMLVRAVTIRRPALADIGSVILTVQGEGEASVSLPMEQLAPGNFQTGGEQLDRTGGWNLGVVLERPGIGETTVPFAWTVGGGKVAREPIISDKPLAPVLTVAAATTGLILLLTIGRTVWKSRAPDRRRPTRPEHGPVGYTVEEAPVSSGATR